MSLSSRDVSRLSVVIIALWLTCRVVDELCGVLPSLCCCGIGRSLSCCVHGYHLLCPR
jgi:hypothetical protein